MKLQMKPNRWSCAVTAWAMALDISVLDAVSIVGHNGSNVVFPELAEPMCRQGFHQQELVELALQSGASPVPFQLLPVLQSECGRNSYPLHPSKSQMAERFRMVDEIVRNFHGVLEGRGTKCHHAVAYDCGRIFDPDGHEFDYSLENCEAQGFYGKQLWIFNL